MGPCWCCFIAVAWFSQVYSTTTTSMSTSTTTTTTTTTSTSTTITTTTPASNLLQPSLRTEENHIVLSVPQDAAVRIRRYDDDGNTISMNDVVTTVELDLAVADLRAELTQLRLKVQSDLALKVDLTDFSDLSNTVSGKADRTSVDDGFQAAKTARDSLQAQINEKADQTKVDELSTEVDTKAASSSLEAVEDQLVATWPEFQDFTDSTHGWQGANLAITECGIFGKVLGGYGRTAGATQMTRVFRLPVHSGVRIEFDFIFIDSWDDETARVMIDGQLLWQKKFYWRGPIKYKNQCGRAETHFAEHVEHIDLTLWDHTAETLTIVVSTDLEADARDESYAIDNVFIHEARPFWPEIQEFDGSGYGWTGASASTCGTFGPVLGEPGSLSNGATISNSMTHLPTHQGLKIDFDVVLIDEWSEDEKINVIADGRLVWNANTAVQTGNLCGSSKSESLMHITAYLDWHTSQVVNVEITSTLPANSDKSFVIAHFAVSPSEPRWPGIDTFEEEDEMNNGWYSNGAVSTDSCGGFGSILGGAKYLGTGRYVEKTYKNLPEHEGLQIDLDYIFIDSWDSERALVLLDGRLIWDSGSFQQSSSASTQECGKGGTDRWWLDQLRSLSLTVWDHTSSQAILRVTSTLSSAPTDEAFGIDNVKISPAIRQWPSIDTFETSADGWTGTSTDRTNCGEWGRFLGGVNKLARNSFVTKTFTRLPQHNGLQIELDFFYIDSWDNEAVTIYVDGQLEFRRSQRAGVKNMCGGGGGWTEEMDHVVLVLDKHSSDSVTIRITTTLDGPANDESWGIDNVHIGPIEPRWPPVDNFQTSLHGWSGSTLSSCGGTIIYGGYNIAGQGVTMRKTFSHLPAHNGLQVTFDFWFIDTWDGESGILRVDGREVWRRTFRGGMGFNRCGRGNNDYVEQIVVTVTGHTATTANIELTTSIDQSPDDESFGMTNFKIDALN